MKRADKLPIVYARRVAGRETDLLVVRCVYCLKEHTHGVGGLRLALGFGDGPRVADCGRGSYDLREYRRPRRFHRGKRGRKLVIARLAK